MPEVFKLQSPSTGKVVQIEADSPEMAFDILDEIEAGQMGGATAALGLPNAAPAVDMGKRFLGGVGRALNPMNLLQAGADVAGSQLDALSQGDLTGLIPFAPMAKQAATRTVDRLGEATRLAVDEGDYLGAAGQASAAIPVVGEMAAGMGQRAADTGDYAGMAGELTGMALGPKVGGAAIRGVVPLTRVGGKALRKAAPFMVRNAPRIGTAVGGSVGAAVGGGPGAVAGGWIGKEIGDSIKSSARAKSIASKAASEKPPVAENVPKVSEVEKLREISEVSPPPNPPAKPSSVPQTARDVDSALKSLDKASQARLKHVVKKAEKEGADIKPGSYADDAAKSAERQKQHIADSYAAKEVKDAANVKRSESLIPDLEQSAELLKQYPKRGGETNSQWMQRVTKKINEEKSSPSAAQEIANDLAGRIQELSVNQGMSRAQIKAVLEQNHGIPSKYSSQMVNMVLGKKGKF